MICSRGLVIGPSPVLQSGWGDGIYAEIVPAPPLRLRNGRSWREPHIRWWFEVQSDRSPGNGNGPFDRVGTHFWMYDGGATTLSGAVRKAIKALRECVEELNEQDK